MLNKKSFVMLAVGFVMLTFITVSWAGSVTLPLMAKKAQPGASGTAILADTTMTIQTKGLKPNSVYTVWFVNMKPKKQQAGAGVAPYMFKTDSNGNGTYEASVSESPFGKWAVLMVVLHPTGDPMDMKNMEGALSAMIPKAK